MAQIIRQNTLDFIYGHDNDMVEIIKFINSDDSIMKKITSTRVTIDTSTISSYFCDTMKNIIGYLPTPKIITLDFTKCLEKNDNNIINLLNIFDQPNDIHLTICVDNWCEIIKQVLSKANIKKIDICASYNTIIKLLEAIDTNLSIKTVDIATTGYLWEHKSVTVTEKLSHVTVDCFNCVNETDIHNLFTLAPNLTGLTLHSYGNTPYLYKNKLEKILNYAHSNPNFEKLYLQIKMTDEDTIFVLDNITHTNIKSFSITHKISSTDISNRMCDLIRTNNTIEWLSIMNICSISLFTQIIQALSLNSSITTFFVNISSDKEETDDIKKIIDDVLQENYTIKSVHISGLVNGKSIILNDIETTIRNNRLAHEKRFVNTKSVVQNI